MTEEEKEIERGTITYMEVVKVDDFLNPAEIGFDLIGYNQIGAEIFSQSYETEKEAEQEKAFFLDSVWKVFFQYA